MKHSTLFSLAAIVLATATFSPIAAAQTAAARDTLVGFFAQANYPSTSAPAPLQSYNSKGLTNEVRHDATGRWTVTFRGLGDPTGQFVGLPAVTANGNVALKDELHPALCTIASFKSAAPSPGAAFDAVLDVRCFAPNGLPDDATYVVAWSVPTSPTGLVTAAQADAGKPTDVLPKTAKPPRIRQFSNSSGGTLLSVTHNAVGSYKVSIPLNGYTRVNGGTVHLTTIAKDAVHCRVARWDEGFTTANVLDVNVLCYGYGASFSVNPVLVDSAFLVSFADGQSRSGTRSTAFDHAYVWLENANFTTAPYAPRTQYQFTSVDGLARPTSITARRFGGIPGTYALDFAGLRNGPATPMLTDYGTGTTFCGARQLYPSGTASAPKETLEVLCFDPSGISTDAMFVAQVIDERP